MKYVRQLLIILFVSFFGELLKYIIPLSIPASISFPCIGIENFKGVRHQRNK